MTQVKTFCRVCEPSCGLVAEVDDGQIVTLKPDKEHPVTQGFACHKGLATLEIHQDEDRLNYPMKRLGPGETTRISWSEATTEIADKIQSIKAQYGDDAIASYTGNPLAFNSLAGPAIGSFLLNNKVPSQLFIWHPGLHQQICGLGSRLWLEHNTPHPGH